MELIRDFLHANLDDKGGCTRRPLQYIQRTGACCSQSNRNHTIWHKIQRVAERISANCDVPFSELGRKSYLLQWLKDVQLPMWRNTSVNVWKGVEIEHRSVTITWYGNNGQWQIALCVMIGSNRGKDELVKFSEYKMPRIGLTLLAAQFQ